MEDAGSHRLQLEQLLDGLSLPVTCASSGIEAINAIANHEYAGIFMDIELPGFDALQVCSAMRAIGLKVPIIGYSAARNIDSKELCDAGMNDFFQKPADLDFVRSLTKGWIRGDSSSA